MDMILNKSWLIPSDAQNGMPLGKHVLNPEDGKTYLCCQMSSSETGTPALGDSVYDDLTTTNQSVVQLWAAGVGKPRRTLGFITGTAPTAGQYFLAQTGGAVPARTIKTNGDDDIAAGDAIAIKTSAVGVDIPLAITAGQAADRYFNVGYATAADSNTYNTVACNLDIFSLA